MLGRYGFERPGHRRHRNPIGLAVFFGIRRQPKSLVGLSIQVTVADVVDQQVVLFGELGPEGIEGADQLIAARVQQ